MGGDLAERVERTVKGPLTLTPFQISLEFILRREGPMSLDPGDPGNWTGGAVHVGELRGTQYGISAAAFPALDIAAITASDAADIYLAHYWRPIHGDALPPALAFVAFDCAVNQGVAFAIDALQQALGVRRDGVLGRVTLAAAAVKPISPQVLEFCALRALRYAKDPDVARYGLGWMRRLCAVLATATTRWGNEIGPALTADDVRAV